MLSLVRLRSDSRFREIKGKWHYVPLLANSITCPICIKANESGTIHLEQSLSGSWPTFSGISVMMHPFLIPSEGYNHAYRYGYCPVCNTNFYHYHYDDRQIMMQTICSLMAKNYDTFALDFQKDNIVLDFFKSPSVFSLSYSDPRILPVPTNKTQYRIIVADDLMTNLMEVFEAILSCANKMIYCYDYGTLTFHFTLFHFLGKEIELAVGFNELCNISRASFTEHFLYKKLEG